MMKNMAPKSMWCWAMLKASQDLNFNYNEKIKTSPYHFKTCQHIDMKYLHSFFAECYMFIPLKDCVGKLPHKRALRCKFLAYSYKTIPVPTYIVLIVNDNGTYRNKRISKDVIFDESVVFATLQNIIENMNDGLHEKVKIVRYADENGHEQEHIPESPRAEILDIEPIRRYYLHHWNYIILKTIKTRIQTMKKALWILFR